MVREPSRIFFGRERFVPVKRRARCESIMQSAALAHSSSFDIHSHPHHHHPHHPLPTAVSPTSPYPPPNRATDDFHRFSPLRDVEAADRAETYEPSQERGRIDGSGSWRDGGEGDNDEEAAFDFREVLREREEDARRWERHVDDGSVWTSSPSLWAGGVDEAPSERRERARRRCCHPALIVL
jgi:hypothetical protein